MLASSFDAQVLRPPAEQEHLSPQQGSSKDANYPHYLPFVDGLRAISIVAVVLYHVGVPGNLRRLCGRRYILRDLGLPLL